MKVKVEEKDICEGVEYPLLMKSKISELIVFMTSRSEGVAINNGQAGDVGTFSKQWNMINFEPFKGKITLEND